MKLRSATGLFLIEDAAQAIGAEFPFRERIAKAGTMGEVGFLAFILRKILGLPVMRG